MIGISTMPNYWSKIERPLKSNLIPVLEIARCVGMVFDGYSHVIGKGDLALLVTNNWELELGSGDLIDILDPSSVRVNGVGGETDQLDTTLGELWLELGESSKLGGADWSVILWVREKDSPFVANELVEVNWAVSGISLEVWGNGAKTKTVMMVMSVESSERITCI